jgi:hypothetical protein
VAVAALDPARPADRDPAAAGRLPRSALSWVGVTWTSYTCTTVSAEGQVLSTNCPPASTLDETLPAIVVAALTIGLPLFTTVYLVVRFRRLSRDA